MIDLDCGPAERRLDRVRVTGSSKVLPRGGPATKTEPDRAYRNKKNEVS